MQIIRVVREHYSLIYLGLFCKEQEAVLLDREEGVVVAPLLCPVCLAIDRKDQPEDGENVSRGQNCDDETEDAEAVHYVDDAHDRVAERRVLFLCRAFELLTIVPVELLLDLVGIK